MRRKALFMVLSEKARRNQIIVLDELGAGFAKTKALSQTFKLLPFQKKTAKIMLVLPAMELGIIRSAQNLPRVRTMQAREHIAAVLVALINLSVDILLVWIDPRIRMA